MDRNLFLTHLKSRALCHELEAYVIMGSMTCLYIILIFSGCIPHVSLTKVVSLLNNLVARLMMCSVCLMNLSLLSIVIPRYFICLVKWMRLLFM